MATHSQSVYIHRVYLHKFDILNTEMYILFAGIVIPHSICTWYSILCEAYARAKVWTHWSHKTNRTTNKTDNFNSPGDTRRRIQNKKPNKVDSLVAWDNENKMEWTNRSWRSKSSEVCEVSQVQLFAVFVITWRTRSRLNKLSTPWLQELG